MALVLSSPTDLINDALVSIGRRNLVGNLYDGSTESQLSLAIYGQTRDDLLRAEDWDFAQAAANLTLLKSAPVGGYAPPLSWNPTDYPSPPWLFEYAYPADCLKVRLVKAQPVLAPNMAPSPNAFVTPNDNTLPTPAQVILCNVPSAVCLYTRQVTDPLQWNAGFVETFADALAEKLGAALVSLDAAKLEAAKEASDEMSRADVQG